jgi:hypothetical protein
MQVCGGNAGALVMAASRYDSRGGWKAGKSGVVYGVDPRCLFHVH